MHALSRRTLIIVRAAGIDPKTLSHSDLERRALWASASEQPKAAIRLALGDPSPCQGQPPRLYPHPAEEKADGPLRDGPCGSGAAR